MGSSAFSKDKMAMKVNRLINISKRNCFKEARAIPFENIAKEITRASKMNFTNKIKTRIRQMLKLSKLSVMGSAKNKGIDLAVNITESSREEMMSMVGKKIAKNKALSRGKIPIAIKITNSNSMKKAMFMMDNIFPMQVLIFSQK